jgi:oxygen-independent coproporphyrinogen-3 oxidase
VPPLGVYVHVPYCAARCGYCDFNTYVAPEAERRGYAAAAIAEVGLAAAQLGGRPAETVFFGGGTPTLLAPAELGAILRAIEAEVGLAPGAEVTVEANPESVDAGRLAALREQGFTRVSFGMQSAAPHVLAALERRHTPGRAAAALREARAAGFAHVSADLIYGTPGETAEDWRVTLEAALEAGPDHVSAYGLVVERGTRLAAQVRRGERLAPDPDVQAERYEAADALLGAAGLPWYEICSFAATPEAVCRHNLGYWSGGDWWGVGPGAHSHVGGVRWWNVKRPAEHAALVAAGRSPAAGREVLGPAERETERVMLGLRLAEGLPAGTLPAAPARRLAADGLLDRARLAAGRAVLTLRGRLLADHAIRELIVS